MESEDRLGNLFSDEEDEDSFDDPVPMSKSGEAEEADSQESSVAKEVEALNLEEEDFDLVTIEKVSMDVLVSRMTRVISEIMYRGEPAAVALFDVATKIVFQSTILDEENACIDTMVRGLTKMILDVREREERTEKAAHMYMLLVAKLAVKNKSLKCEELFLKLIPLIDHLYLHFESVVRTRICRLIALIVEESNRYTEAMQELGDNTFLFTDDDMPETETMIPDGVKKRWMRKLGKSLLDKAPLVRSEAVTTLSLWDHDTVYQTKKGDELTVNELLWKSVYDVDEGVRMNAARRVHIIGETDIDKCMNYVETSKDTKVRQAIVLRLSSDVHMFSMSEEQRFRLVNILNSSDSARVQDTLHQRLVNTWMAVAESEICCPSIFPGPKYDDKIPDGFPTVILEYLNPLIDPNAVYVFLKFAVVRFIRKSGNLQSNNVDIERFLKELLQLTVSESECLGLMRRSSFRLLEGDSDDEECLERTFIRVFITRCFVDAVFQLSRGRLDSNTLRNRALAFFVPDVSTFSKQLVEFCQVFFQHSDEPVPDCAEVLLFNIFHLVNVSIKHGNNDFDKESNTKALERLLKDPKLQFSSEVVVAMVTMLLDLCKNSTQTESTCEWISEAASDLLLFREDDNHSHDHSLEDAMKEGFVLDRMYLRSAKMLLATCQHTEVREPSPAMTALFKAMIPALLGNQNEQIQVIGLELIGFAASIDFDNCGPYLKLTRLLILRDDQYLKATGLHTFVRVVKSHGFEKTSQSIFDGEDPEEDPDHEESLAKLIEKTVVSLQGLALAQAVRDCLSMLSHGNYAWPRLLSALLLIIFQKSNEELQLVALFLMFCKSSVRSKWSKAHLLQAFTRAISVVSKTSDANWKLEEMTSVICEQLSSVQTVGEDEDNGVMHMGDGAEPVHIEVELANRMLSRAQSHPSAWFVRHVFTSMATSLSLQCVPIEQLKELHNSLVDGYTVIRFSSVKLTQIAVKRFLTHCEKMITLYDRRNGLNLKADLRKVKEEVEDPDSVSGVASSSASSISSSRKRSRISLKSPQNKSKKKRWESSDDSFEYVVKPTRTRPSTSSEACSPNDKPSLEDATPQQDDSFDLAF